MDLPIPKWVSNTPEGLARTRAEDRFLVRIAYVYHAPDGNLRTLAENLGVNYQTLKSAISNCKHHTLSGEVYGQLRELLSNSIESR